MVVGSLLASGCGVRSYQIPKAELVRLAHTAPEVRGARVRVVQEVLETDVPPVAPVTPETQVVVGPNIWIDGPIGGPRGAGHVGGGGGGHIGGSGGDGKGEAIAIIVIAVTAVIVAAIVEGSRFDGFAQLHPMQPIHLIHGNQVVALPLAAIDDQALAWADTAIVKSGEGPFAELERAPLDRQGLTYGVYGGVGSLQSRLGDKALGPAWTIQLGYFPTQQLGILGDVFFGWRDNRLDATVFETRAGLELQYLPMQLGLLHAGLYGGLGYAWRFEDAVKLYGREVVPSNDHTPALDGGAMLQLDINTRVALTARLGLSYAHGEQMSNLLFGLSVY